MDKFSGLEPFVKAADLGSFVAAGRALGMSASAVGKSVARLEAELGARLMQRNTRRIQLTEEGHLFHQRAKRVLDELSELRSLFAGSRSRPRGRLRVSAPVVGHHFLTPLLPDFVARFPEVELDVVYTDRHLDLIEAGVDVAIRSGELPDSRLVSRSLQQFRLHLCATPAYVARAGRPAALRELAGHAAIRFRHPNSGKLLEWPLPASAAEVGPRMRTVLACNHVEAVWGACLSDMGIACMPDFLVRGELARGQLLSLLDTELEPGGQFRAIWLSSRHLAPKIRVFVDHLCNHLAGSTAA